MGKVSRPKRATHKTHGGLQKSEPYKKAAQIPHCIYLEMSVPESVWRDAMGIGAGLPASGRAEDWVIEEEHILPDHVHMR
jgi:hypothetical protein